MKHGQFAVEYLATYGWVILSIIISISALTYFGILSPSQYVPDRCSFGYQLICEDYRLTDSADPSLDGNLSFRLRNNFARPIEIVGVEGVDSRYNTTSCTTPGDMGRGEVGEFTCEVNGSGDILEENKYTVPARIRFKRNASGAPEHYVTGSVYTQAR